MPDGQRQRLIYVLVAALLVFLVAHWAGITNPYVINDDVRQQLFWMEQWSDPELFQNDPLTDYAKNYVPLGVKAIYWLGAQFMSPVQFSKVLTGILFVITAGLVFGLALKFEDNLTPVLAVCVYFLFGSFLGRISGGLSRAFVFPLLVAYLFFLGRGNVGWASVVILVQSALNPYVFILCFATHCLFLLVRYGRSFILYLGGILGLRKPDQSNGAPSASLSRSGPLRRVTESSGSDAPEFSISNLVWLNLPALAGAVVIAIRYVFFKPANMGNLVTKAQMLGKIEYSALGRYELLPQPCLLYEFGRIWTFNMPFREWGGVAGVAMLVAVVGVIVYGLARWRPLVSMSGFGVFGYVLPTGLVLYALASALLMALFVPRRYIEYPLVIFLCLFVAVCLRMVIEDLGLTRRAFPWLTTALIILAAIRLHNVNLYDYSAHADLYRFLRETPKTSLLAGPPQLMDNVVTFSGRKAFITYELSHTWIEPFWKNIKQNTFDFFRAYYSDNPKQVRSFCRKAGIDYLIVRDSDFDPKRLKTRRMYFEPFGAFIKQLAGGKKSFALMNEKEFPVVFKGRGIRVIKIKRGNARPPIIIIPFDH